MKHLEKKILGCGKEKRQKIFRVFKELGYLNVHKTRNPSGTYQFDYVFSSAGDLPMQTKDEPETSSEANSTKAENSGSGGIDDAINDKGEQKEKTNEPENASADFSGAGEASAGEAGHIHKTDLESTDVVLKTELQQQPAPESPARGGCTLVYPEGLHPIQLAELSRVLSGMKIDEAQMLLDELAARNENLDPNLRVQNPSGWARGVQKKGLQPTAAGLAVASRRKTEKQFRASVVEQQNFELDQDAVKKGTDLLTPGLKAKLEKA